MIDCGRCVMGETRCRDCAIAVTETRNVTARLGQAELQALRVLADAGLVPPLARVLTSSEARNWVFPDVAAVRTGKRAIVMQ
jgi:hypothetical protein